MTKIGRVNEESELSEELCQLIALKGHIVKKKVKLAMNCNLKLLLRLKSILMSLFQNNL